MDVISLCCAGCIAGGFGDPTLLSDKDEHLEWMGLAATSLAMRTEAPDYATWDKQPATSDVPSDGLHLDEARLGLVGRPAGWVGLYAALAANDSGLGPIEAYGDIRPFRGFEIRAGHWIQQLGPVSGRRVEQRCFSGVPLGTERFVGPTGLFDTGLELRYAIPIPRFPILVSASVLSGQRGLSFGSADAAGEGADVFGRLLYVLRVVANPGKLFDSHLTAGFLFATGANATGPDNRTDLLGGSLSGMFPLGPAMLGVNVEYLMRRFSVPKALHVEGALAADVVAEIAGWHAGVRLDLLGLPVPPSREDMDFRLSLAAGYSVGDLTRFRLQYSARNDNLARETAHEVTLQAIVGLDGALVSAPRAVSEPVPVPVPEPRPTPPPGVEPAAGPAPAADALLGPKVVESTDPADWMEAASADEQAARTLADQGKHAPAAFHSQQVAHKSLRAVALARRTAAAPADRSATGALEALARDGEPPPAFVFSAARELDRLFTVSRYPPELGGAPARYFDRAASDRSQELAASVLAWARAQLGAGREPAPAPAP